MNDQTIEISVIAIDPSLATEVTSVVSQLGFRSQNFSTPNDFLKFDGRPHQSCAILCAGNQAHVAKEFQQSMSQNCNACPSIIVISDVSVREAVKLMEDGALTVMRNQFEKAELAEYIHSAIKLQQSRQKTNARVTELQNCRESLSDRQLKILTMVEQGHSNRQIASWFDLSQRTIELERARLMDAFQSASVAQLVSKWTELRVLTKTWHSTDTTRDTNDGTLLNA